MAHIEPTFTVYSPESNKEASDLTLTEAAIRILKYNGQMYSIDVSSIDGVATLLLKPAGKEWEVTNVTSDKTTAQEQRDDIFAQIVAFSPVMTTWAYAIPNEDESNEKP